MFIRNGKIYGIGQQAGKIIFADLLDGCKIFNLLNSLFFIVCDSPRLCLSLFRCSESCLCLSLFAFPRLSRFLSLFQLFLSKYVCVCVSFHCGQTFPLRTWVGGWYLGLRGPTRSERTRGQKIAPQPLNPPPPAHLPSRELL